MSLWKKKRKRMNCEILKRDGRNEENEKRFEAGKRKREDVIKEMNKK